MHVKSQSDIKKKYEASTSLVTEAYKMGVADSNWKDTALAGQSLYVESMQNPTILARRSKGINKVSDEQWRNAAIVKGAPVIAVRMKAASSEQSANFEPYRQALESMTLPAKTTDPLQNVINRIGPIAVKFKQIKNENP